MSIYRQFWLAIIGLTALAFVGSFVVSLFTARAYIEQQLFMKNVDNASSLALVLSQMPDKDPVTVELLISSQFDTGHYQEILLTDPNHQAMAERRYAGSEIGAPDWFVKLFPIQAAAGIAQVQDGWRQFGTLKVVSHTRFAYAELWRGSSRLAAWFLGAGLFAGLLGNVLLRWLFRPLNRVVEQAEAIQERRFVTVEEPSTRELRAVVVAMNAMVERLKSIFSEEAGRLDELRRKVNHDALTDLPNREYFLAQLRSRLGETNTRAATEGSLALIRITHLETINSQLGRQRTDALLQDVARCLKQVLADSPEGLAARLNGADFALLASGEIRPADLVSGIESALVKDLHARWPELEDCFHAGVVTYRKDDSPGDLLASADKALAFAEQQGPNAIHLLHANRGTASQRSQETWRQALSDALRDGRIKVERYPVLAAGNRPLHQEAAARVQLDPQGPWLSAGDFMPMALRLKLSSNVDMDVIQIALDHLESEGTEIAVNLSAETIADWQFTDALVTLLERSPDKRRRLWIEVPEYGAFRNFDAFRSFCTRLDPLGCKLGIEHFGQHFSDIARLAELGLDYLKVDSSYVRGIDSNPGNQEFLRGLCRVAHNAGVLVIGEGVASEPELTTLMTLGFDGATGIEISRQAAKGG